MKRLILLMFLTGITFGSCCHYDDVVVPVLSNCDKNIMVNEELFNQVSTNNYRITNVVLNVNCLEITISASGCNPDNWKMNLIASENVIETLPIQQKMKIELINNEDCLTVFQKTVSFDLTSLQMPGTNKIQLSIEGWNNTILYQY